MTNTITHVNSITSSNGMFVIQGTTSSGSAVTVEVSFQEYMLLFTRFNTEGADVAVASMIDNSKYLVQVLQDISNAVVYINQWLAQFPDSKPDDKHDFPNRNWWGNANNGWIALYRKYQFARDLDMPESGNREYRRVRALLDNLNELQQTYASQNEQWNTRTSNLVSSRGTAIELAKTILSNAKEAMSATTIR